jgi:hypothetical protein
MDFSVAQEPYGRYSGSDFFNLATEGDRHDYSLERDLMEAGCDSYAVDFRRSTRTYWDSAQRSHEPVALDMWSRCWVDGCSTSAAPARPTQSTSLGRSRELGPERPTTLLKPSLLALW